MSWPALPAENVVVEPSEKLTAVSAVATTGVHVRG
jgi:hypothetical protein